MADIHKWKDAEWKQGDVVIACQIISHDAPRGSLEPLPADWRRVLEEINKQFPRFLPSRSAGCPSTCPFTGEPVTRFATVEFFTIKGA